MSSALLNHQMDVINVIWMLFLFLIFFQAGEGQKEGISAMAFGF